MPEMQITPLGETMGAEVTGIDPTHVRPVFPGTVHQTPEQHIAFSLNCGGLDQHPLQPTREAMIQAVASLS
jgi:hypothetical protein